MKNAVRKAEAAATLAAEHSVKRGHKPDTPASAEEKVRKLAADIEDDSSMKEGGAAKKVHLLMHHITHDEGKGKTENH